MAIYQRVLDVMGDALIARDAPAFLRHIILPCRLETETRSIDIPDAETALRHFLGFSDALAAQGVDSYTRIAKHARFDGPDRIAGHHETHITARGKLVVPSFGNEMELLRHGADWGLAWVRHHARYVAWPDVLPRTETPR